MSDTRDDTPSGPRRPRGDDPRYAPPEIDDERGLALMQYLDGTLPPERRAEIEAEIEAWLASDPAARRVADEHRRVWAALGDAFPTEQASPEFAAATVLKARREEAGAPLALRLRARGVFLAAAVLLVGVVGFAFWSASRQAQQSVLDEAVIGHLHVLSELPFLEAHGEELDLALDLELVRQFQGEEARR